jgi:DNA-binding transcriptional ArsR family regulator
MPNTPKLDFSQFIANRIANIKAADSFAFASAIGLGPWLVPLAPAIVFGYALHRSAPVDMGEFRLAAAVSVAIGLVVAGAVSSHNAIVSGGSKAWALVVGYIGLEIVGLWLMSVTGDVKIVGTVASLLTLIVYLSRSSAKEIEGDRNEAKELERTKLNYQIEQARLEAEHKRAMAAKKAELKHAETIAKIEAREVSQGVSQSVSQVSRDKSLETLKDPILDALGGDKPNMTQLAEQLGVSRGTLYRHLGAMAEQGVLHKNGNGYEVKK